MNGLCENTAVEEEREGHISRAERRTLPFELCLQLLPKLLFVFRDRPVHVGEKQFRETLPLLHLLRRNRRVHRRPRAPSAALLQYHLFVELLPEILFFLGQGMAPEGADLGEETSPALDLLRRRGLIPLQVIVFTGGGCMFGHSWFL